MNLKIVIAGVSLALAATGAAHAAVIVNGDFALPNEGGGWGQSASIPGWVSNTTDTIEVGNSAIYGLPCVSGPTCQNLEVNDNTFGSVSQTVTGLTAGDTYTLSWQYGGRSAGGAQQLNVFADSTLLTTDNSDGVNAFWTPNSFKFTADASGSETFTFASVNVGGNPSYGNEVTDVALAVPEPATWAMMLLGVGMIGGGMRMRRRQDAAIKTA